MPEIIAITGATGFVGRHVAMRCKRAGYHVRLLVRNPQAAEWLAGYEVIKGALEEESALKWLADGASAVVHCAGAIKARRGAEFDLVNMEGTRAVVEAALGAGVKRFVHLSSLAAREPALSHYAASKRKSEQVVKAVGERMLCTILRPPAIYGPGDTATLALFQQMVRPVAFVPGGRGMRLSMLYVEDMAEAIVHLVQGEVAATGIHEIADGRIGGYKWTDLAQIAGAAQGRRVALVLLPRFAVLPIAYISQLWGEITGKAQMLTPGKVAELYHEDWVCHGNLLEDVLDWSPRVDFAKGFCKTLEWYRREEWL